MRFSAFGYILFVCAFLSSACSGSNGTPDTPVPPEPAVNGVYKVKVELTGETIPGSKEDRKGCLVSVVDEKGNEVLSSSGGIRLRGNGTKYLEKSPYDLKLDKKASVLGMPEDKRWVLLANYLDRTSLRNDVGLEIARRAEGMAWNPRGEFVNLYYDGKYGGLYFLCEKIKISKHRVNIDELTDQDVGEIVMCKDYNGPASTYMYKSRGGRLFAGPIWDLDLYTFSKEVHDVNSFLLDGSVYYSALLKDSKFRNSVKEQWRKLKSNLESGYSIYDYIDSRSSLIKDDIALDDKLYPNRQYSLLAGDENVDFGTAVEMMKSFLKERIAALDKLIGLL